MKAKDKFAAPWKDFAKSWQKYYRSPGRPSETAIKVYKKHLRPVTKNLKRKPRVLIFGSTPEVRDLCYEEKCQVHFADLNVEMIMAMSEICKYKNPDEVIIKGDWCNLPLKDNYFDAAMGDVVLSNVPNQKQNKFLKEIVRLLKPQGYFISKMEVVPDNFIYEDYDLILDKFAVVPLNFYKDRASMSLELLVYLHLQTFIQQKKVFDLVLMKNHLQKYFKANKYCHPNQKISNLLNDIWAMWQPLDKIWSVDWECNTTKQIQKYFEISDKTVLKDCYFRINDEVFPIWFMKNKK